MKNDRNEKTSSKIGKNLRKLRSKMNFSKSMLVTKTGLDYHTIAKIESGRTPDPRVYTMIKIASALETSVEELVK